MLICENYCHLGYQIFTDVMEGCCASFFTVDVKMWKKCYELTGARSKPKERGERDPFKGHFPRVERLGETTAVREQNGGTRSQV